MSTNDEKISALAASLRGVWSYIHTGQRAYQGDPGWVIPCSFCGMLHLSPPPPGCWELGDEGIRTPRAEPLREQEDVMAKREARDSYTLNRTSVALGDAHNALCRYVDKIRRRVEELEKWATNSQETVNESDCVVSQEQPKSG